MLSDHIEQKKEDALASSMHGHLVTNDGYAQGRSQEFDTRGANLILCNLEGAIYFIFANALYCLITNVLVLGGVFTC
jgi:hypothetical protein